MNSKFRLEMWREEQNVRRFHPSVCSRKYATLEENEQQEEAKEGEKAKRKRKYKRYKKNVRKALSYSWKCLLLGLQNCTAGYYAPNITATFAHEFSNSSDKTRPKHL